MRIHFMGISSLPMVGIPPMPPFPPHTNRNEELQPFTNIPQTNNGISNMLINRVRAFQNGSWI